MTDFDEEWQILSHSLCKRNYSKRWVRHFKSKTVRELQIQQRRINPTNLQIVSGVQNHVGLADVDHARYCALVTILQVQLLIRHME